MEGKTSILVVVIDRKIPGIRGFENGEAIEGKGN